MPIVAPAPHPAERGDLPPVWIISLERARERRETVTRGFRDLRLPFELIPAVDGRNLTATERRRYSRWRALFTIGRDMTAGDIGCALSHLGVYERMVAQDVPEVLVVEDDVTPLPELVDVLEARAALPPDWQVLTLHSLFASSAPRPLAQPPLADRFRVCTYDRIPFGTQCYLARRSAALRLLAVADPVRMPADELLFRRRPAGLRVYGIEPSPVVHADLGSELGARRASDSPWPVRAVEHTVVTAGKVWTRVRRPSRMRR